MHSYAYDSKTEAGKFQTVCREGVDLSHHRHLWVDAICIDQSNVSERNHQVQLMKQIYSSAERVLVYIGEEQDNSDDGMDCTADVDGDAGNEQYSSHAVHMLLHRPWFRRLWVIQEVARSRSAVVICGSRAVSWDCFARWPFRTLARGEGLDYDLPGILNYPSGFTPTSGGDSLLQLLYDNRNAFCTDPRDKVFGILGLMEDNSPYLRLIDYHLSVQEVYTQTAANLITDSQSLRLLSAAGYRYSSSVSKDDLTPSWVPDWRYPRPWTSLALGKTFVEPFNAGGRYSLPLQSKPTQVLPVCGVCLERVMNTGDVARDRHYPPNGQPREAQDVADILIQWANILGIDPLKPDSEEQAKAFVRTVSADPVSAIQASGSRVIEGFPFLQPTLFDYMITGKYSSPLWKRISKIIHNRRLFVGDHDLLGLGPATMEHGDIVVVLLGGPTPYIFRAVDEHCSDYILIGECCVDGYMNWEAFHHIREEVESLGCTIPPASGGPSHVKLENFQIV